MGDALAVALLKLRGFTAEDFAMSHPSGSLGKRLLLRVADVMQTGDAVPAVAPDVPLTDGLMEMSPGDGDTRLGGQADEHLHHFGLYLDRLTSARNQVEPGLYEP